MATADGEDVQRAGKATLKRKLTGPPRLLLGKTRTRSEGEDRPEARTDKNQTAGGDKSSSKSETVELTETADMDKGVLSEVNAESCRGHCGAAGRSDDIRNRKVNRRRWWRRFSPAVVCNRKQKSEESLEEQKNDGCVPTEGVLQEAACQNTTEENRKRGFNVRTWPAFKRFLTASDVRQTREQKKREPSMTFREKICTFFRGGRTSQLGHMEETVELEETVKLEYVNDDRPTGLYHGATAQSVEVVTVTEDGAPDEDEVLMDAVRTRTGSKVFEGLADINSASEVESPETDKVLDADIQLSTSTASQESTEVPCEEKTDETTSPLQLSTNGPCIRIELVPPDDDAQEDGEDQCWEGSNHNHLLLLGSEHGEQQLLQTARSLVRAAMNAAVDQLTREQQSDSDCVHREPPGCRDHA